MLKSSLIFTNPIRYYAYHEYHDLKEKYLIRNKDIACSLHNSKIVGNELTRNYILFKIYNGLSFSEKTKRHKILTRNLIIYLYPRKEDIDLYYCVVKESNKILFKSTELKDSFEFCHKIQSESIVNYSYDIIRNFILNNGCEEFNEERLLDFIHSKALNSTNCLIVFSYKDTIIKNIPNALIKIKSEREKEEILKSLELEEYNKTSLSSKRRL